MKKKKLLSILVIGALVGAMAIGTVNSANAQTNITIDSSGSSSNHWVYGHVGSGSTKFYVSDSDQYGETSNYTDWAGDPMNDTIRLSGGSIVFNHDLGSNHGRLYGDNGNLTISGNNITLTGGDYIEAAVNLAVNSGATLRIGTGGSVELNSDDDNISGTINASSGTFKISGGEHNLGASTVADAVDFSITGGKATFNSASNVNKAFSNAGTVVFKGGEIKGDISGAGATEIAGTVTNSKTIGQDVNVTSGTLTNASGGSVSGTTTISSGATVSNTAGSLSGVTNNGTLNVSGGTVASINNAHATNSSVTQTGGSVTNDVTNVGTYTISSGSIGGTVSNSGSLTVSGGTVAGVSNTATGTKGVSQSNGTVTSVNNTGNYNLTGGTVTNYTQSAGSLNISNGANLTVSNGTNPLTSAVNVITGGTVQLGEAGNTAGTLDINNGLTTNVAQVTNIGTSTNSALTVQGNSKLDLVNNSEITSAVALTVADGSTLDISSTKASTNGIVIDGSDDWSGKVELTGGTLTILGSNAKSGSLDADTGNLNIGSTLGAGTLNLNNANDDIASDVVVNIASGSTLAQTNGNAVLGTNDNWNGAITLGGGTLTLSGRTTDSTTATQTYNQTDGNLIIDNGGSLTLNTADSKITGTSEVVLGKAGATPADDTAGTLVVNNGLTTNQATVTTAGTSSLNTLIVKGSNMQLTTKQGSNISVGNVTVGDGVEGHASILRLDENSVLADAVKLEVAQYSTLRLKGTSQTTINSGDIWNGRVYLQPNTSASLTVLNDDYTKTTGYLDAQGGSLKIGNDTTSGTLIFNNAQDLIADAVDVTIKEGSKLAMSNGTAFLGTADDWSGAIELSGDNAKLTLSGRTSDSTSATQTYNQSAGSLIIDNGGSLTLNTDTTGATPVSSAIIGGNVQLGEATSDTAGTLVVNNGLTTNQAKVVTAGTSTSNAFSVTGANTAFTTLTDTNFATGSVTVGDGTTNASVLNLSNNAIIAKEVALTVAKNSIMNVADTAQTTINTGDTWNGTINQTAGTITVLDNVLKNATTAKLTSNGGNIIIGHIGDPTDPLDPDIAGTLNLNNTLDSITAATAVTINTNGKLNQSAGTVALNASGTGADIWNGAIDLSKTGNLTVSGFNKTTNGTVTYNQSGGKAKFDGTTLVLDPDTTKKSVISDGSVELTNTSTLTINNGETNNKAAVTMAAGTETMNVTGDSTMTLDKYVYDPTSATPQLIQTAISAGALNVGNSADNTDHSTLEVASGTIAQAANVAINEGSALNITGAGAQDAGTTPAIVAAVTLDSTDTWNGDINMSNAGTADDENISLTLNDIAITVGADPTFDNTGSIPYYSQTGGALTLNNTRLSMKDATLINAPSGSMTLDTDSHFESQSGAFVVGDLQNAGVIHSINTGYENHLFDKHIIGDGAGDEKGEYTIDLYARSNTNKNYDQFGKDTTTISATDLTTKHGIIHVSDWTLNGDIYGYDAPIDRSIAIDKLFKGSVADTHIIDFTSTDKEVFTPIGWYGLHSKGGGNYSFDLNRYNPGVFRGQVSTLAQYQNQLAIDDMIFNHTMVDQGFKGNDYIASNPNRLASANDLYPPYQYSRKDGGLWVKMYGNFERLHAGGLDVGNNAYGTIIGADFGLKELKHGWQFMPTAFIGYNGAHQYWNGYGAYQNGGQLGVMGTWYKNDFMIGAMAYGGVYGNQMSTPRGDDNAFNYFAGSAVKGAYNWKFAKNWALQPNLFVSYNYFGQQNWHTDFGQMGMMSGSLNGINIAPGLNLIYERETWSAYVTLQYMYNINQATGGRAGNVDLPRLSMDRGYLQYGIGVNKTFSDRFSAYLQAVIRNVGRNGVGFQAGFQWRLGKGSSGGKLKKSNVTPEPKKTDIILNGTKVQ